MNRIGIQSGLEGIRGVLFDIGMLKPKTQEVLLAAIDALRGPQPDPDTGLVPCGCGGKAGFHYSVVIDNDCYVECGICGVHSKVALSEEKARDAWNTAMSGATGPDAGEMAPNGDEGAES